MKKSSPAHCSSTCEPRRSAWSTGSSPSNSAAYAVGLPTLEAEPERREPVAPGGVRCGHHHGRDIGVLRRRAARRTSRRSRARRSRSGPGRPTAPVLEPRSRLARYAASWASTAATSARSPIGSPTHGNVPCGRSDTVPSSARSMASARNSRAVAVDLAEPVQPEHAGGSVRLAALAGRTSQAATGSCPATGIRTSWTTIIRAVRALRVPPSGGASVPGGSREGRPRRARRSPPPEHELVDRPRRRRSGDVLVQRVASADLHGGAPVSCLGVMPLTHLGIGSMRRQATDARIEMEHSALGPAETGTTPSDVGEPGRLGFPPTGCRRAGTSRRLISTLSCCW